MKLASSFSVEKEVTEFPLVWVGNNPDYFIGDGSIQSFPITVGYKIIPVLWGKRCVNTCGCSERDESSVQHMQNAHAPSHGPCSDTRKRSRSAEWPARSYPCFTRSLQGRQATSPREGLNPRVKKTENEHSNATLIKTQCLGFWNLNSLLVLMSSAPVIPSILKIVQNYF